MRGEPNTLRFASRERPAFSIEGEIIEPDLEEKFESGGNFVKNLGDNRALLLGKLNLPNEFRGLRNRQLAKLVDVHRSAALLR